jgi:hypothetical protein
VTTRTGLLLPDTLPLEEWRRVGQQIAGLADSSAWWLGDWLIYGRRRYPDRYQQIIEDTSLEYQTLRNYAWVAGKIPQARRRAALSLQHHAEVAMLPGPEQDEWLQRAESFKWSRNTLRAKLREARSSASGPTADAVVRIMVSAKSAAMSRWQEAAGRADQDLDEWIKTVLDRAASSGAARMADQR